jgi:sarcosine oxidase subunit alpha
VSGRRLASGGLIDRSRPIRFTFDGRAYTGLEGDTLASALLANGVSVLGRSFKLHRPRGLMAAGVEEPNALMQLGEGARSDPNPRATEVELEGGLVARAVNCWPNARFDIGAALGLIGDFVPAGFYYKTMIWPDWRLFEPFIRRAAGLGRPSAEPDPDRYETRFRHCDVLVIGGGPAGLAAAAAAGRSGARVMLCEQERLLGGRLAWDSATVDGDPGPVWVRRTTETLAARPETTVLTRTVAAGYFDHNALTLLERIPESQAPHRPRMRLWQVRAKRVVLATGALERPLVFPGNDRPGVMLASAVQDYIGRFGVVAGDTAVIFTNNDRAYASALALLDAGARVAAVVDSRAGPQEELVAAIEARGAAVLKSAVAVATRGAPALTGVKVREASGAERWIAADLLAMSGGFSPTTQLFRQSGGRLAWDEELSLFKPGVSVQAEQSAGGAAGVLTLERAIRDGHQAGERACELAGWPATPAAPPLGAAGLFGGPPNVEPLWKVEAPGKAFVDFQNDVSVTDIALAARESFVSVEHLKRYTTLGMAPDQGKTSNVNALAIMAGLTGRSIPETGTTLYRFPYTPLPFGALAGRARGDLFRPLRRLPAHPVHVAASAVFEDYSGILRPAYYPRAGETPQEAEQREARAVRTRAGLFDGSPLGKIEVVGPDAGVFLDRIYANTISTLKVGKARYGLMLDELGVVIDDGVTLRLAADRFLVGTTGAGAARIAAWLEEWRQCEWPDLRILIAPMTNAAAVLTLSGPSARDVLMAVGVDFDIAAAAFPHMTFRDGQVAGVAARVARVSFTGEVSFEISVPARQAGAVWTSLMQAGEAHGLEPVGIDAWMLLRTEKGYLHIGADTDGTTAPDDIGWGHVLRRRVDFVGRRSLTRPDNLRDDRLQFVGLEAVGTIPEGRFLPIGSHLRNPARPDLSEGYVTSAGYSEALGRGVALAMVRGGRDRMGETLDVVTSAGTARARIVAPGAYDPEGERLNG